MEQKQHKEALKGVKALTTVDITHCMNTKSSERNGNQRTEI